MRVPIPLAAVPALLLAACDLAPAYHPPAVEVPAQFKEAGTWRLAHPRDEEPHGQWWLGFNDRLLDELEPQVEAANPDLAAALANYLQARDYVLQAQAAFYPSIAHQTDLSYNKQSANRPLRSADEPTYYGANTIDIEASYEVDLWGRIRDQVKAAKAQAQASKADLESVRIGLQAELARDYVSLRGLDRKAKLLQDTVKAYQKALDLTRERLAGKIAAPIDVARAEVQFENAKALLADITGPRAAYEHAIATLIGQPASTFSIPVVAKPVAIPTFPPGIPSSLLERRPDIAAAERETAAANESIGVARAAFFPTLTLNGMAGGQDTGLNLLSLPNSLWSVGPTVYLPLFDAGLRRAQLAAAEAAYLQTVAHYRSVVLHAIQEVEDDLANLRSLKTEGQDIASAAVSAQRASDLALTSYREGAVNYLDVVTAQTAALDAQRSSLAIETRRLQTSVALILALGGDWSAEELAVVNAVDP
jgi:NodT family efflux transporter outer membrane factor (OMF) lipoprotein